jgi:imidazolonepropionase-like amidohydrolase
MYADLPSDLLRKLTVEAHKQGLQAWSHATVFPSKPSDVLNAGVDVLSHSALLVYEAAAQVPQSYETNRTSINRSYAEVLANSEVLTNLLRRMRAQGTILDATLFVTGQLRPGATATTMQEQRLEWTYEITKRAHQLGVSVAAGTDGIGRGVIPNIHLEMELLVTRCGFTPIEAITAATLNGARTLGINKSHGTINIGKAADFVVLSADPSLDIRNTQKIVYVVKGGKMHAPTQTTALRNFIGLNPGWEFCSDRSRSDSEHEEAD